MALYVLMSFDNEEHAKNWIETQRIYIARRRNLTEEQLSQIAGVTGDYDVVAMYKKPTMFCNVLDGKHVKNRRVVGFTKGTKWGWWVCAVCGKPREMYIEGIRNNSSFGFNLLPKETSSEPLEKVTRVVI